MIRRHILLNPGPATTTDSVKQALVVPDICPREAEFRAVLAEVRRDLLAIAGGGPEHACVLFGGSGTAVMEACVASVVPRGRGLAVLSNGAYGQRMVEIARAHEIPVTAIESPPDRRPDVDRVAAALAADPGLAALAFVHHETTTGLLNPFDELVEVAADLGRATIVDAVSSFAGLPLDLGRTPVDFLFSSANKCLQGMAGIAFAFCRRDALARLANEPPRTVYLDLVRQHRNLEEHGETRFTPPVQVVYALRQAIREYQEETGPGRWARYADNIATLRDGLAGMGFRFLVPPSDQSPILLTVLEPRHPRWSFGELHDRLLARGFTIYPGKLGAGSFRLAVLGAIDRKDIQAFLAALREVLHEMGVTLA